MCLRPAAVIFDLDGCLVDSEPLALAAITEEMRAMGVTDITFDEIRSRFLGVSMRVICEQVAQRSGRDDAEGFVERVETRLFDEYRRHLKTIEGAPQMLSTLQDEAIPIAIATGGSLRRMQETLTSGGLDQFFEGSAFSADQVEHGKPAPDLFLLAAANMHVRPEHCLVLEDSPHGIEGAVAAGMRAIGFVGGSHLDGVREAHADLLTSKGAERVVATLEQVLDAILSTSEAGLDEQTGPPK
ncbi:MAG: HAD family phosphatase [Rhodobacteraceae bacterium]|nr:HAD family phosphatase [Paracoccaceae bacterium]